MSPVTTLFDTIDEVTVIWLFMTQPSIFIGLLLEIETWLMTEFSIMQPELDCSFQLLADAVKDICPPLKVILSAG